MSNDDFVFPFLSPCIRLNYSRRKNCPFSPIYLFIHLFSCLFVSVWTCGYLLYPMDYILVLFLLCFSNFSNLGHWENFQVDSFALSKSFLEKILYFSGTTRCSRLILYFPCPSSVINHFYQYMEPWFHLLENNICKPRSGY